MHRITRLQDFRCPTANPREEVAPGSNCILCRNDLALSLQAAKPRQDIVVVDRGPSIRICSPQAARPIVARRVVAASESLLLVQMAQPWHDLEMLFEDRVNRCRCLCLFDWVLDRAQIVVIAL